MLLCTPRTSVSACRVGTGCSLFSCFSVYHVGKGCTSRIAVSASRGGRGCTPRNRLSVCRGGRGCTPRSFFSPSREGRACTPCSLFSPCRADTGRTPRSRLSACRDSNAFLPFFPLDRHVALSAHCVLPHHDPRRVHLLAKKFSENTTEVVAFWFSGNFTLSSSRTSHFTISSFLSRPRYVSEERWKTRNAFIERTKASRKLKPHDCGNSSAGLNNNS